MNLKLILGGMVEKDEQESNHFLIYGLIQERR